MMLGLANLLNFFSKDAPSEDDQSSSSTTVDVAVRRSFPPEHPCDGLPVLSLAQGSPMLPAVICSQELRSAPLCQSLSTHGYAVVRLSAEETATVDRMTEQLRRFMELPLAEKKQQGGSRSLAGVTVGWEMLDFPNDHVPRLPEERDVFSVPLCAVSEAPWPSEPFRIATREVLRMYANLSNALLQRLASELGCGLADLLSADSPCFELLNPDHDPTLPSPLPPSSSSSSSASSLGPADRFSELKNNNGLRR